MKFLRINTNSESRNYLPILPENWLIEIEKNWLNKDWSKWVNVHYDICKKICNDVYKNHKYWEKGQTHAEFLSELTIEQRAYFVLINFESQVNNGGVYQFLSNNPDLSIIALEAMKEVKLINLSTDYKEVLIEYFGDFETFEDIYGRFVNENSSWEERWAVFEKGYAELKSADKIEGYFYEEDFVKYFQSQLVNYVKENPDGLFISN